MNRETIRKPSESALWVARLAGGVAVAMLLIALASHAHGQSEGSVTVQGAASGVPIAGSARKSGIFYVDCGASTTFANNLLTCPGSGVPGVPGPPGPTGTIANNVEFTMSQVMNSDFCPSWVGTFTGSSALSFTLIAPISGCMIGVQNNTTQPLTINVTTNSLTLNGQTSNGTIPACATPANGCQVVVIKANGTTSWDMSAPGANGAAGATGSTGPGGATGTAGATGPTGGGTSTIASGTAALGTSAIASGACASVVTVSASGVATTDNISADFNADPTSTTGYSPSAGGMLGLIKYPTANNVNFKVCNNTSASITPGAVTLNWRVVR